MNRNKLFIFSFVIRLALYFVNSYLFTFRETRDGIHFEQRAYEYSQYSLFDYLINFDGTSYFISWLWAPLYMIFGRVPIILDLSMVLLGAILVVKIYDLVILITNSRETAIFSGIIAMLFPHFLIHSILFLREIPANITIVLVFIHLFKSIINDNSIELLYAAIWVLIATLFHSALVFLFPVIVIVLAILKPSIVKKIGFYPLLLFIISMIVYFLSFDIGLDKFSSYEDGFIDDFEERGTRGARGGAAYPSYLLLGSIYEFHTFIMRYIAFLFSPLLPFLVNSPRHILGIIDAVIYLYMIIYIIYNKNYINTMTFYSLSVSIFILTFAYSFGVNNFGAAIRHRAKIAPLIIVLYAIIYFSKYRLQSSPIYKKYSKIIR